jgi:hypothetical protein
MNKHEVPERPETFQDRFRDAMSPRTLLLGVGVLLLQLGFIASYIGAFHHPVPQQIPVTVVATPAPVAQQVADRLNGLPGQPLRAATAGSETTARDALRTDRTAAVYLVDAAGSNDTLLLASAGGSSVASAAQDIFTKIAQQQRRFLTVDDVVPVQPGDARGLSGFYLVIGWVVGGYLFAALLGVAKGERPANFRRAIWRLAATVPYAIVSGIGGALIVGPILGALNGNFWDITGIGALVTLSSATVTIAFETLLGVLGIGLTVIVFVILGNPSAGGAYQSPLLPSFWAVIGPTLPNGAGTDALRCITYFGGHGIHVALIVLAIWIIGGTALTLVASRLRGSSTAMPPTMAAFVRKLRQAGRSGPPDPHTDTTAGTAQPRPDDADHSNRPADQIKSSQKPTATTARLTRRQSAPPHGHANR